jgi:hypothetical protein
MEWLRTESCHRRTIFRASDLDNVLRRQSPERVQSLRKWADAYWLSSTHGHHEHTLAFSGPRGDACAARQDRVVEVR